MASSGWYVDSVTFQNVRQPNLCLTTPPPALDFHTLAPCRLVDTRWADGPRGGPALQPGQVRSFLAAGACGVPATARALSVNVTAVDPGAAGNLSLFPADQVPPGTSTLNFPPGVNRANNALVSLSGGGALRVKATTTAPAHFVLDVNGFFEE